MTDVQRSIYLSFISIAAGLGGFLFGFDAVVVSGVLPLLEKQFSMGVADEGFLVAASLIGCMVSAPIAGVLADRYGRRPNLFAVAVLTVLAAALSAWAAGEVTLTLARFAGGLGIGIAAMICPLYIAEISPKKWRGLLVSLYQFSITIGICACLFSNVAIASSEGGGWLGKLIGGEIWRAMFAAQILPGAIFLVLCGLIPESPRWLVKNGERNRADRLLRKLMPDAEADATLAEIVGELTAETVEEVGYRQLMQRRYLRPMEIASVLAIFSQFSGISVVLFYGPTILGDAGFVLTHALDGFAVIGIVNMVATLIALWLVDRVGRRVLLLWGSLGAILSLAGTGLLLSAEHPPQTLLVVAICCYITCFAFSLGPIKFVVAAEIFPNAIRARAVAMFILVAFAADSLVNLVFPLIRRDLGAESSFFLFALILVPQVFYVFKRMPETAGRSLEDIQSLWGPAPMTGEKGR